MYADAIRYRLDAKWREAKNAKARAYYHAHRNVAIARVKRAAVERAIRERQRLEDLAAEVIRLEGLRRARK